jgi:AraC-like DNA-binding protein
MLTAKTTMNDKINGLEIGADDFIMKPFDPAELKARIKNLLAQRKRLHKHFQKYGLLKIEEKQVTSMDQKFLQKAIEIINDHISDSTFSIEMFAENLTVSRSLLHKKFIALIGESPGEVMKRIRLNKAANLIEHNSGNFTEIAFEVGFNDPSYFAACFRKQFGVSPSRYYQDHFQN